MRGFSIIVCCYNSSTRIIKTLEELVNLRIPDNCKLEVIIINNNSRDNTEELIRNFIKEKETNLSIKIFFEKKQGLNHARICGIIHSKYDYLIFCDDDNWLFPDYLEHALKNLMNRKCIILGGVGIPYTNVELPNWFKEVEGFGYAIGEEGRTKGFKQMVYGAGMCLKREFALKFTKSDFTFLTTDRSGKSLSSGGDTEICLLAGLENVYFDNNLKFFHFLPEERLSIKYWIDLNYSFGKSNSKLFFYKLLKYPDDWIALKVYFVSIVLDFVKLIKSCFDIDKKNISFFTGSLLGKIHNLFYFFKYRKIARSNFNI